MVCLAAGHTMCFGVQAVPSQPGPSWRSPPFADRPVAALQVDDCEAFAHEVRQGYPAGTIFVMGGQSMGGLVAAHVSTCSSHYRQTFQTSTLTEFVVLLPSLCTLQCWESQLETVQLLHVLSICARQAVCSTAGSHNPTQVAASRRPCCLQHFQ